MLPDTLSVLQRPYGPQGPPPGEPEDRVAARLGVATPKARELEVLLAGDLDPTGFGIGWWQGYRDLDPPRRIFIADQLVITAASVPHNLLEATLHRLGAEHAWHDHTEYLRRRLQQALDALPPQARDAPITLPGDFLRPRSPGDELGPIMADLHLAGLFRAVGSTLDCLGGVLVGVAALPLSILKADFGQARQKLAEPGKNADPVARDLWMDLSATLERLIEQAGPSSWLEWALAMRNMLVHRGRHRTAINLRPIAPGLTLPPSAEAARLHADYLLPRDPERSEVEVLRDSPTAVGSVLSEHGGHTVSELIKSTITLVEGLSGHLAALWQRRRAAPDLLPQPAAQWKTVQPSRLPTFDGYAPGAVTVTADSIRVAARAAQRVQAAALVDSDAPLWETWMAPYGRANPLLPTP